MGKLYSAHHYPRLDQMFRGEYPPYMTPLVHAVTLRFECGGGLLWKPIPHAKLCKTHYLRNAYTSRTPNTRDGKKTRLWAQMCMFTQCGKQLSRRLHPLNNGVKPACGSISSRANLFTVFLESATHSMRTK